MGGSLGSAFLMFFTKSVSDFPKTYNRPNLIIIFEWHK
jgi:hypothetical protein